MLNLGLDLNIASDYQAFEIVGILASQWEK
jgi:hypothetical protein